MSVVPVPEAFFIHSDLEIQYSNPAFCALLEAKSQEQLVGSALTELVTSDYWPPLRDWVNRIENGEEPSVGLTVELQTFTETPHRATLLSTAVEWDGIEQVKTSVFPITAQDPDSSRPVHNQAPIGISVSDPSYPDNPLVYVNNWFCKQTGYDREEILGRNCRFLQGEDTREKPVAKIREMINAEKPVSVELRNYRKDGSMFWNRVTVVPVLDESGTVTNWLGYQQDVTEKKRYEQDLSLFKTQAEESEKAIVITDSDGVIQYVNPAFERTTGYTAAEANGRNPRMFKSDQHDEAFYAELWGTITVGDVWEAELVNKTKYGELYEARHTITPVTDANGEITHFVGIIKDITENVLTSQTLSVLNRVLRHNLSNSLNVIDGHAELLEDETLDRDARQASVAAIRDQAASMQKISEVTGKVRSVWDTKETHSMWQRLDIESLVETYQRQFPDADITCGVADNDEVLVRNAALFNEALGEAVTNAVKHAEHSRPDVTVTVQQDTHDRQLRIRVTDDGPGIPERERKALESGEETPLGHSRGIGLWIMEWTATTLGGGLTITDNEPQGSVVTFQLPIGGSNEELGFSR